MLGKSSEAREMFALNFEKEKWVKNEITFYILLLKFLLNCLALIKKSKSYSIFYGETASKVVYRIGKSCVSNYIVCIYKLSTFVIYFLTLPRSRRHFITLACL